ncbi:Replicative DNA helicase [Bathymodiolus thermophilus thioautotrophic gill symbiont]|uniref:Replicative DNA helicase n=1 Tax=Bathymodiolus thermophilus thioautotrophic gill symbiont TaxID=2360 RepID=A0A1J5U6E9_9GAMM|nr:replicative DNA helicase [Bathymodiolus thermophilus thioautotrophic gill symbiont]AYQ56445.1 Primary replicative DNA helicase [Bathymodiolus thermophilus thioautotrophic gill symbiont]OIR23977.1 replicative DNA helicase [Bathymodiolus thermophilus thioautotrophic gill symbiont]CAB5496220.1 Replicative DNA helicase (DnaB) (EC [Bathymodiolus thermophilus thioautotrophic gill symbiont]CAB5506242.1 Replicative DNA helicase (DnaB) (EC [Bathymodiolus thermophilus thioautotrophic gill symbiont]SG
MNIENIKVPPNSIESEQSVLGGLLLHNEAWDEVADVLVTDDFYNTSHRVIFDAIHMLLEHSEPVDILTVKERLKKTGDEETVGGFAYLAQIAENTPSISNIKTYAQHVRELSVYRQLIIISQEIADSAYRPKDIELQELIDLSERKIFEIAEQITRGKQGVINVKDKAKDVVNLVQEWAETAGSLTGLETGFTELDKKTSGLQKGDLIIIAGRPSMGKTALAMNIVGNVAIEQSKPVLVFSLEMPIDALILRMISSFGHIDSKKIRAGEMTETDWNSFSHSISAMEKNNILIDETPSITPTEIRAKARRVKRQYPELAVIMVDYLQLMTVHGKSENRVQEISEISRSLKALAKEINVPVIALSQLNRGVESRPKAGKGRMPQMSDLRESGSIEQDADIIAFVYRDEQYHDESYSDPEEVGKADLKIAKHRNGETGNIKLSWIGEYTRFENLAPDDQMQNAPEDWQIDAADANNAPNFETEEF